MPPDEPFIERERAREPEVVWCRGNGFKKIQASSHITSQTHRNTTGFNFSLEVSRVSVLPPSSFVPPPPPLFVKLHLCVLHAWISVGAQDPEAGPSVMISDFSYVILRKHSIRLCSIFISWDNHSIKLGNHSYKFLQWQRCERGTLHHMGCMVSTDAQMFC